MKKGLIIIICLFMFLLVPRANAEEYEFDCVDSYIDGVAYYENQKVTDKWAYDINEKIYVKLDSNGYVIMRLSDPKMDPSLEHGTIKYKAILPDVLKGKDIEIVLYGHPFHYRVVLNKDNNYELSVDTISDIYTIRSVVYDNNSEYEVDYPNYVKVFANKETEVVFDYSKYEEKEQKKIEKQKIINQENNKKYIIYIFIGVFVLFVIVISIMFIKARNM